MYATFVMIFLVIMIVFFSLLSRQIQQVEEKVDEIRKLTFIIGKKVGMDEKDLNLYTVFPIESSEVNEQIITLLKQGQKINAIKKIRELNPSLSLKRAKEYVDRLEKALPKNINH